MTVAVVQSDDGVPSGLILLVGPPASGKSSFARAWVEHGQMDPDGVDSGVLRYAAAARHTASAHLFDEGVTVVVDVPGEVGLPSPFPIRVQPAPQLHHQRPLLDHDRRALVTFCAHSCPLG
jgi:hypothetical protein